MNHMKEIVHSIILNENIPRCTLCFQYVGDNYYDVRDEITTENQVVTQIDELLSVVLGKNILDRLPTDILCPKCVETTLNSYKFIEICKANVLCLTQMIEYLHKYTNNQIETIDDVKEKCVVLAINPNTHPLLKTYQNDPKSFKPANKKNVDQIKSIKNVPNVKIFADGKVKLDAMANKKLKGTRMPTAIFTNENYTKIDESQYKCTNCSKLYPSVFRVRTHYLRIHAPKVYKCPHCQSGFGTHHYLNRHIRNKHGTPKRLLCSLCGRTYMTPELLRMHEKTHQHHRMMCQVCGKVYKDQRAFNNHINQKLCDKDRKCNSNEAKFTCDYCGKRYTQKISLSVHIRVEHTNGKSVKCHFCDKKLCSVSRLKDHLLTHTKEKNFECNICGGKFVSKSSLLYHTRIHTGEKPYKCDLCDARFLSSSRRSQHYYKHHCETTETSLTSLFVIVN